MKRIVERWHGYWFAPESPFDLAIARVVFYGLLFLRYLPTDYAALGAPELAAYWQPVFALVLLPVPLFSTDTLVVLQVIWKASLLLAALGLLTRIATLVAFVLGFYLIGVAQSFGTLTHVDAALVFILGFMAASRCNHVLSVDAALFRWPPPAPTGEYRWPIRAAWAMLALMFFLAGASKLRFSGLAWAFSENLSILLLQNQYYVAEYPPLTTWGVLIAPHVSLTQFMAAVTLVGELALPIALFSARARLVLVPLAASYLVAFRVLLGPEFGPLLICFVFWVPWAALARSLVRTTPTDSTYRS